jgi:hypothetical protein
MSDDRSLQVKDQEFAVLCVQEILKDNRQMLQTKVNLSLDIKIIDSRLHYIISIILYVTHYQVGDKEIGIFLNLLEESPMSVTILKLLRVYHNLYLLLSSPKV